MEIAVALSKPRFLNREAIELRVRIGNPGPTAIDVPNPEDNRNAQPVYTVTGPSHPMGHRFHFRQVARHDPFPAGGSEPGMTVVLAPGAALEAELPLQALVGFPVPGVHTLVAALEAVGDEGVVRAVSPPVQFVVERPAIQSMELALDDGLQASSPIRVLCLTGEAPARAPALYQAIFREERPDLGEIALAALVPLADPEPRATSVVAAWSNHARLDRLHDRFGWRGPRSDLGLHRLPEGPLPGPLLPDETMRLVRPALLAESGAVTVVAIGGDAESGANTLRTFALLDGGPLPAADRWRLALPAAPTGARAAAAPATVAGGGCAVVVVLPQDDRSLLMLVEASADGGTRTRLATIPDALPLPASEPALRIDGTGAIFASALFRDAQRSHELIVADVIWPAGDGEAAIARQHGGWLPVAPRAGVATYAVSRRSAGRREWLVLLEDGKVIFSGSPDEARPIRGAPSLPLALLAMAQMTYLLTLDDDGLPQLELLF